MLLTETVVATVTTQPFDATSATIGLIVLMLLLGLLVQNEMLRAFPGPRAQAWRSAAEAVWLPLALACGFILALRLVDLLHPL